MKSPSSSKIRKSLSKPILSDTNHLFPQAHFPVSFDAGTKRLLFCLNPMNPLYHQILRLLQSNRFWTNLPMFSPKTCPKVYRRSDPTTSRSNCSLMHCPSRKDFIAYQPKKLKNLRNNYTIFSKKALYNPVQVRGEPRSCLSIRKMEGSVSA